MKESKGMIALANLKENQRKLHVMILCYHKTPKISYGYFVTEENLPEGSIFCPSPELIKTDNKLLIARLFDELINQEAKHSTLILLPAFPPAIKGNPAGQNHLMAYLTDCYSASMSQSESKLHSTTVKL